MINPAVVSLPNAVTYLEGQTGPRAALYRSLDQHLHKEHFISVMTLLQLLV